MQEITQSLRKLIASLDKARNRRREGLFAAEGTKCVLDTIGAFRLRHLVATSAWWQEHPEQASRCEAVLARPADMERITALSTPPPVIAVYDLPEERPVPAIAPDELVVALDCVQDPGNLGTIVRAADWMGVHTILASRDTVDIFGAKAVQATMGAISRVKVYYCDLASELALLDASVPVFGTFLGGENIYKAQQLGPGGVLVMGNEGRGVSDAVAARCTRRLTIPSWPPGSPTSESLNVGVATAIALAAFRSRLF
ncbi:MAG: RNA methyltransferase [Muribaculaceae bacterium]|nr:RNA methyltransferase [Muribaculaceae bacterium]